MEGDWRSTAQQFLAELVERGLSRLVWSHVSQTRHSIFAESTSCFCRSSVELLASSVVGLSVVFTELRSCTYSIVQQLRQYPVEPDSASESTVFGTVLYCEAA